MYQVYEITIIHLFLNYKHVKFICQNLILISTLTAQTFENILGSEFIKTQFGLGFVSLA